MTASTDPGTVEDPEQEGSNSGENANLGQDGVQPEGENGGGE